MLQFEENKFLKLNSMHVTPNSILAGSSKEIGKLEETDGDGKVNDNKGLINTDYVNLKAKFPSWESNKKIQLK